MKNIIQVYSVILILCSSVGFVGHFIQFGVLRLSPWIPASVGILLLVVTLKFSNQKWLFLTSVGILIGFGFLTSNMFIDFYPQETQPLRKKLLFGMMSLSSILAVVLCIIDHIRSIQLSSEKN